MKPYIFGGAFCQHLTSESAHSSASYWYKKNRRALFAGCRSQVAGHRLQVRIWSTRERSTLKWFCTVVSRHVEISTSVSLFFYHSLLFLKVWSWKIPKKQFPGTTDISGLRDAVKTVFFLQNQFSVDRSRVLQILTCNLQPAKYTLRKKMRFQTWGFYHSGPLRDQFLPLTIPTMATMLWIETHQPWARFAIHQSLTIKSSR